MASITLRFVTCDDPISRLIRTQAGISMPFTPSHVEALSRDGKAYVGQHFDGGMQARTIGYDAGTAGCKEKLVPLMLDQAQADAFHDYCESKIGQAYDWKSIISFAAPDLNLHDFNHLICSAIMTAALRACGYFPMPLHGPVPPHLAKGPDADPEFSRSDRSLAARSRWPEGFADHFQRRLLKPLSGE